MNRRGFVYSCTAGLVSLGIFGVDFPPPYVDLKDAVSNPSLRQGYIDWLAHKTVGRRPSRRFVYGDGSAVAKLSQAWRLAMLDDPRSVEYVRNIVSRTDYVERMLKEEKYAYGFKTADDLRRFLTSNEGLAVYMRDAREEERTSVPQADDAVNGTTMSGIFDIGTFRPQTAYITEKNFESDSMFLGDNPNTWKEIPTPPSELAIKSTLGHENRHMLDAYLGILLSPRLRIDASNIAQIRPDVFSFVLESRGWMTGMAITREGNPPRDVCVEYLEDCGEVEYQEEKFLDLAKGDLTRFERSIYDHQMPIFSHAAAEAKEALSFAKRKHGVK